MRAKVLKGPWKDYKEDVTREEGDIFICTKARLAEINEKLETFAPGPWIEEVKEVKVKK